MGTVTLLRRKKEIGFTLIELILVLGLVALATTKAVEIETLHAHQRLAKTLGNTLYQYDNGVRRLINQYQDKVTSTYTPPELLGSRTGVKWLKSPTCSTPGTASKNFLSCNFLSDTGGKTRFGGLTFKTYFDTKWNATTSQAEVSAYTVLVDASKTPVAGLQVAGKPAPALSGLAATVAGAIDQFSSNPLAATTDVQTAYCVSKTSSAGLCDASVYPTSNYAVGKIAIRTGNFGGTLSGSCKYLRTDGTCTMTKPLVFEKTAPFADRAIKNVSTLLGSATQGIIIGNSGAYTGTDPAANVVVVDADMSLWRDLTVNSADVTVNNGRIAVHAGTRPGSGDIQANELVDDSNTKFKVDPSNQSRINEVAAAKITNNADVSPNLDVESAGTTSIKADTLDVTAASSANMNSAKMAFSTTTGQIAMDAGNGSGSLTLGDNGGSSPNGVDLKSKSNTNIAAGKNLSVSALNSTADPASIYMSPNTSNQSTITLKAHNNVLESDLSNDYVFVGGQEVTLNQLLGNYIHMGQYYVYSGQWIPRPNCLPGWTPRVTGMEQYPQSGTYYYFTWVGGGRYWAYNVYRYDGPYHWTQLLANTYCARNLTNSPFFGQHWGR